MDLVRITMDAAEARTAYREHRRRFGGAFTEEDAAVLSGYRALARGRQLMSLRATMRKAGVDERGLPRLAICRADAEFVYTQGVMHDGSAVFRLDRAASNDDPNRRIRVPAGTFPRPDRVRWETYSAMVPMIPRPIRPSNSLNGFHVLWEVNWRLVPPEDPALLQHVGGDLYAVVAVWELTELERAVLAGRLGERWV